MSHHVTIWLLIALGVYTHAQARTHACMHPYAHAHPHPHPHAHAHPHAHIHPHKHTPTHACTHAYTHVRTHKNDAVLRCLPRISFTYYSAYDKDWKLSRHSLSLANSMTSLLILYSKFVWQIWFGQRCLIWLKNVWWLAIIISPTIITSISLPLIIQFLYLWILFMNVTDCNLFTQIVTQL